MSKAQQMTWKPVSWSGIAAQDSIVSSRSGKQSATLNVDINKPLPPLPSEASDAVSRGVSKTRSPLTIIASTLTESAACFASRCSTRTGSVVHTPSKSTRFKWRPQWQQKKAAGSAPRQSSINDPVLQQFLNPNPTPRIFTGSPPARYYAPADLPVLPHSQLQAQAATSGEYLALPQNTENASASLAADPVERIRLERERDHIRTNTRSLQTFLSSTSPSHHNTPSSASSSEYSTPKQLVEHVNHPVLDNMHLMKPHPRRNVPWQPGVNDSTGTYESKYSEQGILPRAAMATTPPLPAAGIAVTQQGIINRPLVARRAVSESSGTENVPVAPIFDTVASPADVGELVKSSPKPPARPHSAQARLARNRPSPFPRSPYGPHLSPLRQEVKDDSTPSSQEHRNSTEKLDKAHGAAGIRAKGGDEQADEQTMTEWGKSSPDVFRRPVSGYFELPGQVDVNAPPDHLQNSFLCPIHPKHFGGQKDYCPLHGHLVEARSTGSNSRPYGSSRDYSEDSQNEQPSSETHFAELQRTLMSSRPPSPGGLAYWEATRAADGFRQNNAARGSGEAHVRHDRHVRPRLDESRPTSAPAAPPQTQSTLAPTRQTKGLIQPLKNLQPRGMSGSQFKLRGPDHSPGDPQCPINSGKGVCVWHGRSSSKTTPASSHDGSFDDYFVDRVKYKKPGPVPKGW